MILETERLIATDENHIARLHGLGTIKATTSK